MGKKRESLADQLERHQRRNQILAELKATPLFEVRNTAMVEAVSMVDKFMKVGMIRTAQKMQTVVQEMGWEMAELLEDAARIAESVEVKDGDPKVILVEKV